MQPLCVVLRRFQCNRRPCKTGARLYIVTYSEAGRGREPDNASIVRWENEGGAFRVPICVSVALRRPVAPLVDERSPAPGLPQDREDQ